MLRDLHLFDGFPQTGSVPGPVLPGDPDLLRALGHPLAFYFFLKGITVRVFPDKIGKITEITETRRQRRLHVAGWSAAAAWEGNRFTVMSAAAPQHSHYG